MADVLSIRGREDQKVKFDEISQKYSNKAEAFDALLKAYEDSLTFTNDEMRVSVEHVRSVCNNLCAAFETLLTSQGAELDAQKRKNNLEMEAVQEELKKKTADLLDAISREKKLQEEFQRVQEEKNTLRELNEALKRENAALDGQLKIIKENQAGETAKQEKGE